MKNGELYDGETLDTIWPAAKKLDKQYWWDTAPASRASVVMFSSSVLRRKKRSAIPGGSPSFCTNCRARRGLRAQNRATRERLSG